MVMMMRVPFKRRVEMDVRMPSLYKSLKEIEEFKSNKNKMESINPKQLGTVKNVLR